MELTASSIERDDGDLRPENPPDASRRAGHQTDDGGVTSVFARVALDSSPSSGGQGQPGALNEYEHY